MPPSLSHPVPPIKAGSKSACRIMICQICGSSHMNSGIQTQRAFTPPSTASPGVSEAGHGHGAGAEGSGNRRGLLAHVLSENNQDWLSLGMFVHYVKTHSQPGPDELRRAALRHLENAFAGGLLIAGDVVGTTFHPWQESYSQALQRIADSWPADSRNSYEDLRDICWLANTPAGNLAVRYHQRLWTT